MTAANLPRTKAKSMGLMDAYFSDCDRPFHFYVTDPGGMLERAKS